MKNSDRVIFYLNSTGLLRFEGWGVHDCDRTEAAGVRCQPRPAPATTTTTTPAPPKLPMVEAATSLEVRLAGGRTPSEGRLELRVDGGPWGAACGDGWGLREAVVTCRQLGLGYAAAALDTDMFGGGNLTRLVSGLACRGDEASLLECGHDRLGGEVSCDWWRAGHVTPVLPSDWLQVWCPGTGPRDLAAVVCTARLADLQPDLYQLVTSAYLEDKPLFTLQCAMEENCVASGAYTERQTNPYWQQVTRRLDCTALCCTVLYCTVLQVTRRLLRFTTAISNIGNEDFRPFIPKDAWQWHACHQHYHSMEVFSHFEIMDLQGNRVVEGHKVTSTHRQ